jgi:ribulose kinase
MNEGGQSSTGQLIDFMIDTHPAAGRLKAEAKEKGINHFVLLQQILERLQKEDKAPFLTALTKSYYL